MDPVTPELFSALLKLSDEADVAMCCVLGLLAVIKALDSSFQQAYDELCNWMSSIFPSDGKVIFVPRGDMRFNVISVKTGRRLCTNCTPEQATKQKGAVTNVLKMQHGGDSLDVLTGFLRTLAADDALFWSYIKQVEKFSKEVVADKDRIVGDLKRIFAHKRNWLYLPGSSSDKFTVVSLTTGRLACRNCSLQQIARQRWAISRVYI